ncbi:MAG: O-antigen ligase family protein [Taibaiella sp.]|nr:O-antigen ligase family protein [Taibaiella sp.]
MPAHLQVFVVMVAALWFVYRTVRVGQRPARNALLWALFLGGGYFLYLAAIPLSPPEWRREVGHLCERRVSFLLMPVLFAVMAPRFRQVLMGQLMYFVYGTLVASLVVNAAYAWHYFLAHDLPGGPSHVIYRIVIERFTGIHPTYLSMYLCFSIGITMVYLSASSFRQAVWKWGLIGLMLAMMLAMFAKAPLFALVVLAMIIAVAERRNLRRYRWGFAGLGGVVALVYLFIPFFRQRAGEMLGLFGASRDAHITDNSVNVRKLLLNTDAAMLKHHWVAGVGPGRLLNALHQRYFFQSLYRGYWVGYFDPHSQYFYEWLSFGLIGIACLITVLVVQLVKAVRRQDILHLWLLVIVIVTFFTESLLARQQGVLFYSIFTSLLFFAGQTRRQEMR